MRAHSIIGHDASRHEATASRTVTAELAALAATLPVSLPVLASCVLVMSIASVVFGVSGFGASLISVPLLSQLVPLLLARVALA